jgi:hypothetical protein
MNTVRVFYSLLILSLLEVRNKREFRIMCIVYFLASIRLCWRRAVVVTYLMFSFELTLI